MSEIFKQNLSRIKNDILSIMETEIPLWVTKNEDAIPIILKIMDYIKELLPDSEKEHIKISCRIDFYRQQVYVSADNIFTLLIMNGHYIPNVLLIGKDEYFIDGIGTFICMETEEEYCRTA